MTVLIDIGIWLAIGISGAEKTLHAAHVVRDLHGTFTALALLVTIKQLQGLRSTATGKKTKSFL